MYPSSYPNPLIPAVLPLCKLYIHHCPVLLILVLSTGKLYNDITCVKILCCILTSNKTFCVSNTLTQFHEWFHPNGCNYCYYAQQKQSSRSDRDIFTAAETSASTLPVADTPKMHHMNLLILRDIFASTTFRSVPMGLSLHSNTPNPAANQTNLLQDEASRIEMVRAFQQLKMVRAFQQLKVAGELDQ